VGSVAALFNSLRFIWSAFLDKYSYKVVYGTLLCIQILLALSIKLAVTNKIFYAIWVCLALFCEGGHFTLVPNILRKIFGDQATSLYGIAFSYTGLNSLLMVGLLLTSLGTDYIWFFGITGILSFVALMLLIFVFSEEKFKPDFTFLHENK